MFPVDSKLKDYNERMIEQFDELINQKPSRKLRYMPKVLVAGDSAGLLSDEGLLLILLVI